MSAMPVSVAEEMRVAEQLLARLAPASVELLCDDERMIAFAVRQSGWKLSRLFLGRESLRRLARDPQQKVKLEWLTRDISAAAPRRRSYAFPYRLRAV